MKRALLAFNFLATILCAQQKGVSPPSTNNHQQSTKNTYAVVVGISDYQDPAIPDLRFADKDAEAFAFWLKSDAGGKLGDSKIQFLSNKEATNASIYMALNWLMEECKEGDRAILYFSGHGDVETKTIKQNGFLLGYDTPASVYMAGAISLYYLQDVISTLSEKNKSKVLVITDACHAGKLAGSSINGPQITSSNLSKQFSGETKILSCQPNEFSLEGQQWGGGRGLFSYHLIDGLTGLADKNLDHSVSLIEIDRYLGDLVSKEAAPILQTPFTVGDRNVILNLVVASTFEKLNAGKLEQQSSFAQIHSKGFEDEIYDQLDTLTKIDFINYTRAIEERKLIEPANSCAWFYFQKLNVNQKIEPIIRLLRRKLAVALLDEIQQALNALLRDDPYEINQWFYNINKYTNFPEYLSKAIELLGNDHYLYKSLLAKKLFFEAISISNTHLTWELESIAIDSINELKRPLLRNALQLEPNAAYIHYALGNTWSKTYWNAGIDSFSRYLKNAIQLSPTWMLPRLSLVNFYMFNCIYPNWDTCKQILYQGLNLLPDSYILTESLSWVFQRNYQLDSAIILANKLVTLRKDLPNGYGTLGSTYLALRKYDLAESYTLQALAIDSTSWQWQYQVLLYISLLTRKYDKYFSLYNEIKSKANGNMDHFELLMLSSLKYYCLTDEINQAIDRNYSKSSFSNAATADSLNSIANLNFSNKQWNSAKNIYLTYLDMRIKIDTTPSGDLIFLYKNLGLCYAQLQKSDSAEFYFLKAYNYYPKIYGSYIGREEKADVLYQYARFLISSERYTEAEKQLIKSEEIDPRNPMNYFGFTCLYLAKGNKEQALIWFSKALESYYPFYEEILHEPLFNPLKMEGEYIKLMKQYFPNGSDRPRIMKLIYENMSDVLSR